MTEVRTISLWVNLDVPVNSSLTGWYPLITRETDFPGNQNRDEFGISFTPIVGQEGRILFYFYDDNATLQPVYSNADTWTAGTWYHLVAIFDPVDGMKMYIDGVLQSDTNPAFTGSITQNIEQAEIGGYGDQDDRIFDGRIDDVKLYNYGLSDSEVQALFNE